MADSTTTETPSQAQQAVSIWHRLIPAAAMTFHSVSESIVDRIAGASGGCRSESALWTRTISFLVAWAFGLSVMKWSGYTHGHILLHAAVNVTVVTAWLLAISQYPLVCWAGHAGPGYDLSVQETHSIGLARLTLVAVMEAATALEINSFVKQSSDPSSATTRSASSSHFTMLEQYLPSGVVMRLLKWYHKAWRRHIPGVALTLQATLASGIEASYGALPTCDGSSAVWRSIAFGIALVIGSVSMCSEGVGGDRRSQILGITVRVLLTAAWLLSVSEVPLLCWLPDDSVGIMRLILTGAVIGLAGLTERLSEEGETTSAVESTKYGAISESNDT